VSTNVVEVVNLSQMDPGWNWLEGRVDSKVPLQWTAVTTKAPDLQGLSESAKRWAAGRAASSRVSPASSVLVSHGPHMTMYGSAALASRFRRRRHLAYAFNFTELPGGVRHKAMSLAFRSIDRFVCFSTMERKVYAEYFGIDIAKIDMIHWAVKPPEVDPVVPAAVAGEYICALGSQGRDYATLMRAMSKLPSVKLVVVATPASIAGLSIPDNVEVRCGVPLSEAMNILAHSRFNVVTLKGSRVPCGHVTIVAGMHFGKSTVVTDSLGIADYVHNEVNGITVTPYDVDGLALAIESLWYSRANDSKLGTQAQRFASEYCVEPVVSRYFEKYLASDK
jgi:glycosyltransferase involved in cell wall biosynthesis